MARRSKKRKTARSDQAMVVWQPLGFNPCDYLPQHLHRYADYARFYVGMIVHFTHRLKNVRRKDKEWTHLSHRKASRFFPDTDTYKAIRDARIAARVVECDWDYEIGSHSMGYRLGESYRHVPIHEVKITGKAGYHLRKKHGERLGNREQRLGDIGRYLLGWLGKIRVSRYAPKALDSILDAHNSYRVQFENLKRLKDYRGTILIPISRDAYGRIHTPVAHGWKGFRGFLTIDRAHLVGIDIRNSQPLIFGLVLRQMSGNGGKIPQWLMPPVAERVTRYLDLSPAEVRGGRGRAGCETEAAELKTSGTTDHKQSTECKGRARKQRGSPRNTHTQTTNNTSGMTQEIGDFTDTYEDGFRDSERTYVESSTNVDMMQSNQQVQCLPNLLSGEPLTVRQESLAQEVDRYVQLCEEGRFYNWMMDQFGIPSEGRNKFKRRVFANVMFGRLERSRHSSEWKLFERAFPHIAKLIVEFKRQYGYPSVAHLLQRVESSLMIDRVCRRLMQEHQEVPVVTIHDSILTTRKNVNLVKRIIEEEFIRVGLRPIAPRRRLRQRAPASAHSPGQEACSQGTSGLARTSYRPEGASDDACAQQNASEGPVGREGEPIETVVTIVFSRSAGFIQPSLLMSQS